MRRGKVNLRRKESIASLNLTLGKEFTDEDVNEAINEAGERIAEKRLDEPLLIQLQLRLDATNKGRGLDLN